MAGLPKTVQRSKGGHKCPRRKPKKYSDVRRPVKASNCLNAPVVGFGEELPDFINRKADEMPLQLSPEDYARLARGAEAPTTPEPDFGVLVTGNPIMPATDDPRGDSDEAANKGPRVRKTAPDYCGRLVAAVGTREAAELIGIAEFTLQDGLRTGSVGVAWEGAARAHWQDLQPPKPVTQLALVTFTNPNVLETLRKLAFSFDFAIHEIE